MNVTATLGVQMAPGATPDEVEAALDLTSLSADDPIGLLSNDPDRFFGRTTKVCQPVKCSVSCCAASAADSPAWAALCDHDAQRQSKF